MKKDLVITNSSGIHAKKAGEFGLMSILMLQNHMTRIITNQKNKEFITLLSKPIEGKKVVVVGTGSLGGSMIKHISSLGAKVIGVNRRGGKVEGCSKIITFDRIDEVLSEADFLYLSVPETNETKGLINKNAIIAAGYRLLKIDTLDNRPVSEEILKKPSSPVLLTCIPPHSSMLKSPILTTLTTSPYFSSKNAVAPSLIAFLYSTFSLISTVELDRILSLHNFSI